MSDVATNLRLEGLEPDNLLGFLAMLGLLRSLDMFDRGRDENQRFNPRVFWDLERSPLRPVLRVAIPATQRTIAEAINHGVSKLASVNSFGDRPDLNYPAAEARDKLETVAQTATSSDRVAADLLASLMSDAAIKDIKASNSAIVDPTPFCLLFGQGHQHFLERLTAVPLQPAPPPRGQGKSAKVLSAEECLEEALFASWHRTDPTFSFRWDPEEDVRYALMAGDPTDPVYKGGTQHGANRLAAVGLTALTLAPETRAGRVRPSVLGGAWGTEGFQFSWPIWRLPATLAAIRGMLAHPGLLDGSLPNLAVDHVRTARRISVGKFMNFTRAMADSSR